MLKRLAIISAAVVGLPIGTALLAGVVFLSLGDAQYQWIASRMLSAWLDTPVEFHGPFSFEVSWHPTLIARDIRVGGESEDRLDDAPLRGRLEQVEIEIDLRGLRRGAVILDRLVVDTADITLAPPESGENTDVPSWRERLSAAADAPIVFVEMARLEDVRIHRPETNEAPPLTLELKDLRLDELAGTGSETFLIGDVAVNGQPLRLQGEFGTLSEAWNPNSPYRVRLDVTHTAFAMTLDGHVNDPLGGEGIDLGVRIDASDLRALDQLIPGRPWPSGWFSASGRLSGTIDTLKLSGLNIEFDDAEDRRLRISGKIADTLALQGVSLGLRAELPKAQVFLGRLLGGDFPKVNNLALDADLSTEGQSWHVRDLQAVVDAEMGWTLAATGDARLDASEDEIGFDLLTLDLAVAAPDTNAFSSLIGREFPDLGPVTAGGTLRLDDEDLRVEDLSFDIGREEFLVISGRGRLGLPGPGESIEQLDLDVALTVVTKEASDTAMRFDLELPTSGPLTARSRVVRSRGGPFRVEDLDVTLGADPAPVYRVTGKIGDLRFDDPALPVRDVELVAKIEGPGRPLFEKLFDTAWLDPGPFTGVFGITGNNRKIRLSPRKLEHDGASGLKLRLGRADGDTGLTLVFAEVMEVRDLRLPLSASAPDTAALRPWLDVGTLHDLGEISGNAILVGTGETLELHDLSLRVGPISSPRLKLSGRLGDLNRLEKITLTADFWIDLAEVANPFLGNFLPSFGQVEGHVELSDADGSLGIESLEIATLEEGDIRLRLSGLIDDIERFAEADLTLEARIARLAVLRRMFDPDWRADPENAFWKQPIGVESHFLVRESGRVATLEGAGSLGEGTLSFDLGLNNLIERPEITGSLHLTRMQLGRGGRESGGKESEAQTDPGQVFSEAPIDLPRLTGASLDLTITLDEIIDRLLSTQRIHARLIWNDTTLALQPLTFSYKGGASTLDLRIDAAQAPPAYHVAFRSEDMDLGSLLALFEDPPPTVEGDLTAEATLTARGRSPREFVSSLNGTVALALENGRLNHADLEVLAPGTFRWMTAAAQGRSHTTLRCVIGRFQLEDGVAESESLLLMGDRTPFAGKALFDFGKEEMDVVFAAENPRLAPPSMSRPFRFHGRLNAPEVDVSTTGHMADLGKLGAEMTLLPFVFLPWRAADFLFSRIEQDSDGSPCVVDEDPRPQDSQ